MPIVTYGHLNYTYKKVRKFKYHYNNQKLNEDVINYIMILKNQNLNIIV